MVEEDWDDPTKVRFLYHESEEAECMEIVPALGLVLQKLLATSLVWQWFSEKMKQDCDQFEYDVEKGVYDPADKGKINQVRVLFA